MIAACNGSHRGSRATRYLETGDLDAEREPFPRLLRFGDYLWALRDKHGLPPVEDLGIPNVWIDHEAYRNQRDRQCAFNLYAAAMFRHALAPLAEAMGDSAHAAEARRRGDELLRATTAKFWSKEERVFFDNLPWLGADKSPHLSDRALATAIGISIPHSRRPSRNEAFSPAIRPKRV